MSDTDTGYLDDIEDAPLGSDLYDPSATTDEQFLAAMAKRYPETPAPPPAPAPAPASQSASQGPPATSPGVRVAQAQLAALNQEIARLDEEAAAATPEGSLSDGTEAAEKANAAMRATLPIRAKAEDLRRQAFRIEQQITHDIVGLDEGVLALMQEDLVLELDDVQKTLDNAPAESMRDAADAVRVARAIRQRDALLMKADAVKHERNLQRELKAFDRARTADIQRLTEQAIEEQRDRELAQKFDQARHDEGGLTPDLAAWIRRQHAKEPITDKHREQVYAAVAAQYDDSIRKGVLDSIVKQLGG